jgi:hypothetical protein
MWIMGDGSPEERLALAAIEAMNDDTFLRGFRHEPAFFFSVRNKIYTVLEDILAEERAKAGNGEYAI